MTILLLEDDIALNKAIKKVLEIDRHSVKSCYNGQEALEKLNEQYDLYILDINVPLINGLALLDIIYKKDNSSKVIIISSNSDIDSLQKAYKLGCVDYLRKPFHLVELRIKIDRLNVGNEALLSNIKLKNQTERFTKKEKQFLILLLSNENKTVTYAMIENSVYVESSMSMDGLRALVRRLRAKLADIIIKNVLDEGYTISTI